jgi:peptide/nickel transport system permease protein
MVIAARAAAPIGDDVARPLAAAPVRARRRRLPSPGGALAAALLVLLVGAALVGPALLGADPGKQALGARFTPPAGFGGDWTRPFGADQLGRDLLARCLAGLRLSLVTGVGAALVAATVGATLGLVAGLRPGRVDAAVVFLLDVALAAPFIVVAIAVTVTLGGGWTALMLTLVATGWAGYARILRLEARGLRSAAFVEAARAAGASDARILLRHLLPNVAGVLVVLVTQQAAAMMLYEAALSYLGLGLGGDAITLGGMIADGQDSLLRAWWVVTLPGAVLAAIVLAFTLGGDWLVTRSRPAAHRSVSTRPRRSRV